jgi:hypothetical protein
VPTYYFLTKTTLRPFRECAVFFTRDCVGTPNMKTVTAAWQTRENYGVIAATAAGEIRGWDGAAWRQLGLAAAAPEGGAGGG